MNYFKIGARRYRAEIRQEKCDPSFAVTIEVLFANRWRDEYFDYRATRPAARRALKRELERLAIDPDGRRANWTIVRRGPVVRIRVDASRATASLRKVSRALSLLGGAAAHAGAAFDDFGRAYRSPEVAR